MVVCNELRSHSVHSSFQEAFQPHFSFKKVILPCCDEALSAWN